MLTATYPYIALIIVVIILALIFKSQFAELISRTEKIELFNLAKSFFRREGPTVVDDNANIRIDNQINEVIQGHTLTPYEVEQMRLYGDPFQLEHRVISLDDNDIIQNPEKFSFTVLNATHSLEQHLIKTIKPNAPLIKAAHPDRKVHAAIQVLTEEVEYLRESDAILNKLLEYLQKRPHDNQAQGHAMNLVLVMKKYIARLTPILESFYFTAMLYGGGFPSDVEHEILVRRKHTALNKIKEGERLSDIVQERVKNILESDQAEYLLTDKPIGPYVQGQTQQSSSLRDEDESEGESESTPS
jgi:hypothetical protein